MNNPNLQYKKRKPNGYWKQWKNLEPWLRYCMSENNGLIPSRNWFRSRGFNSIDYAIEQHGGIDEVRLRMGIAGLKRCKECSQNQDIGNFRIRTKNGENFRNNICKKCDAKNVEDYRSTNYGRAAQVVRGAKARSKKYGWAFNLTSDWVLDRLNEIGWRCEVTNIPFDLYGERVKTKKSTGYTSHYSLSIDRVDSNKGYTQDNVQFVLNWVNCSKKNLDMEEFFTLCSTVTKYSVIQ